MSDRNLRIQAVLAAAAAAAVTAALAAPAAQDAATESAPEAGVVAVVNAEPIYFEDLERRLESAHSGQGETHRDAYDLDRLVERLVNDTLLAQEARASGIDEEPEIVAAVAAFRRKLAFDRLEQEAVRAHVSVSEEELQQVYDEEHATVTLRIITTDEREQAAELLGRLRDGADFEALAAEHSVDQYSKRGGLIDGIARIDLPPELAVAIWAREPGQLTEPVRTGLGWSIVRVEAFADADPAGLDALRGRLTQQIMFRKAEGLRVELARSLRESLALKVDGRQLDAISCKRLADGRLLPEIADPAAVVAQFDGGSIRAEQLGNALQARWKGVRNEEAALAAKPLVLDRLLRLELMQAEALRRGYGDTPEAKRALAAFERQLLVRRYIEEVVTPRVEIKDEEMQSYYEEQLDSFRKPPRLHLSQITVAGEDEARKLAELLRQGSDVAWLAREHSIDRFKDAGGAKGWMVPVPGVDEFQDRLLEARAGDVIGPRGVPGNFIVTKVDAREEQGEFTLEQVARSLRQAVFARKFQEYLDDYLRKLHERSEITIDQQVLDSLKISAEPAEEEEGSGAPPAPHGQH